MTSERCIILFFLGVVAINPPILMIFASDNRVFGIPVMFLYLFAVWAAIIALAALTTTGKGELGRRGWRAD